MKKMIHSGRSILNFSRYCMSFAGIWQYTLPTRNVILQKTYAMYMVLIKAYFPMFTISINVQFFLTVVNKNASEKTEDEVYRDLSYVVIYSILLVQFVVIFGRKTRSNYMVSFITKEETDILASEDTQIVDYHLRQIRLCRGCNWGLFMFSCGTASAMALEMFLARDQVGKFNREFNATKEKPLVFDSYFYKLDMEKYASCLLVCSVISLVINVFIIVSIKTFFFSCIIFVPSILNKLQVRFVKIMNSGDDLWNAVGEIVMEHKRIISFVENFNESIKYLTLLEYLLNSLNVAAVSIQFIKNEGEVAASPIFHFLFLIFQTFVLGWSANEIKVQSLKLADALYHSAWYEQNEKIKKSILLMIIRAQKPLVLTIGPFDAMTTNSALRIMKASYSYVSLMMNNL
ncbi:odorant receptor 45b-like [Cylas formicarius]|uniref:odorant receptor 45b-like n=1 Tax=Cylas formicarius TaxID=197179 RepID=UPI0029586A40|nr:odorant receptor 45b-like [Cylas formicarius]